MKTSASIGIAVLFYAIALLSRPASAAEPFPSFPMTMWGTVSDGGRELQAGTTISYYHSSGTRIWQYSTVSTGLYWGNRPDVESPTLQEFDGPLTIKVTHGGITRVLTERNIKTTHTSTGCPPSGSITFVSGVCRYDIDLASWISPETFTWSASVSGAVDFSSGSTSTGAIFSGSGSVAVSAVEEPSNKVVLVFQSGSIISASWFWDGIFRAPATVSSSGSIPAVTGYSRVPSLNYEIGSDTTSLTLSGMTATVRLNVGTSYDGKTLKVFRSSNRQATFEFLADCPVVSWVCEFSTGKFSVFAIAAPSSPPAGGSSWSSAGSASGGSGWSSVTPSVPSSTPSQPSDVTSSTGTSVSETQATDVVALEEMPPVNLIVEVTKSFTWIFDPWFSDAQASFARNEIGYLVSKGIVSGYSDKTFRPNNQASRAEFLKIAMKGAGYSIPAKASNNPFTDIGINWQAALAQKAREMGIISGQTVNGKLVFRPNDLITRAEAMKILFNTMKLESRNVNKSTFSDVRETWMIPFIEAARETGIISGQTVNGKLVFRPNDPITRAEVAKIVVRGLFAKE